MCLIQVLLNLVFQHVLQFQGFVLFQFYREVKNKGMIKVKVEEIKKITVSKCKFLNNIFWVVSCVNNQFLLIILPKIDIQNHQWMLLERTTHFLDRSYKQSLKVKLLYYRVCQAYTWNLSLN